MPIHRSRTLLAAVLLAGFIALGGVPLIHGAARIQGELKQWHKVTLAVDGPFARETDNDPNPFTDYRMTARFTHESGSPSYLVPGYFAADGNAANTSAQEGNQWRAHLSPDKAGKWVCEVSFVKGKHVAVNPALKGEPEANAHGATVTFEIEPSDKSGRDFRGKGRLHYVGKHYLRFAGSGEYFLKAGADSPENFLAFADFDGTFPFKKAKTVAGEATPAGLHRYEPHARDWREGDPSWKGGKGKNIIGALNYLASTGCNAFSFLTYNVGGDGEDVWPFVAPTDKLHYDCSKLDQWGIVFDHAQSLGLYLHFKLQEQEMDDNRKGSQGEPAEVAAALDGGDLGPERRLYCRELIARFSHALALNWNLGEENTQSAEQQREMARYIHDTDPYKHLIVVHTFPDWQDRVYSRLLGTQSDLTGASLQNTWNQAHERTLKWVKESASAGKPWVVANDEQGPPHLGVPPDPGYQGFDGAAGGANGYTMHDIRKSTLWGTLMAGGAGIECYFGYQLPQNDLACEDWRSRDGTWNYCRIALDFFRDHKIPFWEMSNHDGLVRLAGGTGGAYCFAKPGQIYVVYLPNGGNAALDLEDSAGLFRVEWFNPREGGELRHGSIREVKGPGRVEFGPPPGEEAEDWVILVRK